MDSKAITKTLIGKTLYIITSVCSANATETVEKKLERLISRHFSDTKSYHSKREAPVAMCKNKSKYGTDG